MEEKARIFRIWVWFRPIQPPRAADAMAIRVRRGGWRELDVSRRMAIGGNFITVDSKRAVVSDEPWRTSGNQKWNGTRPSFIAIAAVRSKHDVGLVSWVISHWPVDQALIRLENRMEAEAAAWTRKYLIVASMARG